MGKHIKNWMYDHFTLHCTLNYRISLTHTSSVQGAVYPVVSKFCYYADFAKVDTTMFPHVQDAHFLFLERLNASSF